MLRLILSFFAFLVIAWMQASLEFGVLNWFLLMASASLGVSDCWASQRNSRLTPGSGDATLGRDPLRRRIGVDGGVHGHPSAGLLFGDIGSVWASFHRRRPFLCVLRLGMLLHCHSGSLDMAFIRCRHLPLCTSEYRPGHLAFDLRGSVAHCGGNDLARHRGLRDLPKSRPRSQWSRINCCGVWDASRRSCSDWAWILRRKFGLTLGRFAGRQETDPTLDVGKVAYFQSIAYRARPGFRRLGGPKPGPGEGLLRRACHWDAAWQIAGKSLTCGAVFGGFLLWSGFAASSARSLTPPWLIPLLPLAMLVPGALMLATRNPRAACDRILAAVFQETIDPRRCPRGCGVGDPVCGVGRSDPSRRTLDS